MNETFDTPLALDVPVIKVDSEGEEGGCSVEFLELEEGGVLEYKGGLVTLTDGTRWIPVEVNISTETAKDESVVVEISEHEEENIEISTEVDNLESIQNATQVLLLEDGRIAYIKQSAEEVTTSEEIDCEETKLPLFSPEPPEVKPEKERGKKYACMVSECNRSYSTLHHLKVHMRYHTGDRPFKCSAEGCNKAFSTDYSRKAHLRTHTGETPYPCPDAACGKKFKTSGDLQKHIRVHTGERPFVCPVRGCNRSFTTSNIRKVHIRTHTGEKPYACTHEGCDKSFASSTNFKNHMRIHSGLKPYCCKVPNCQKKFTEYSSLYKHQLVHSQQKKHQCNICHKIYRQPSTLTTHKRTTHGVISADDGTEIVVEDMIGLGDTRSKNFKDITSKNCQKKFTEYSSLYKHQLVHSQQKKHQCNICHKIYRQPSTLATHKRTTHGVISADDGIEIVVEDMIGLGDTRSKNFKDITSKEEAKWEPSTLTTHKRTTHGVISVDDGTEIVVEDMIGLGDTRSKNFKDITSKVWVRVRSLTEVNEQLERREKNREKKKSVLSQPHGLLKLKQEGSTLITIEEQGSPLYLVSTDVDGVNELEEAEILI